MKKHSDFTGGHKTESLQKSRTVPHFEYLPREREREREYIAGLTSLFSI